MKRIVLLTTLAVLAATGTAVAGANGPSATGGSHLVAHDVFGLQTLELQDFGFTATAKSDGSADGWFTYRDVEDGSPFVAKGPVWCLTVIGDEALLHGLERSGALHGLHSVRSFHAPCHASKPRWVAGSAHDLARNAFRG